MGKASVADLTAAAGDRAPPGPVTQLLDRLDDEQRAAATLPDGPAQIIAPAGSGKTTTLVARLGVLLSRGVPADRICVVTFNRDAAAELGTRIGARLRPLVTTADEIEVRTLHALARQVLLDAGQACKLVADRLPLLRAARRRCAETRPGRAAVPEASVLDTMLSAWKIEGRAPPPEAETALAAYESILAARGSLDFDDLVVRAARLLDEDPPLRDRWQTRFSHVLVDEFQDVDAAQLRLVRLLAAPEDNLFVVGDDDQTIYAWRLADVRRILRFTDDYPSARRVMLATNYRCPGGVIEASARMVAVNRERFEKPIRPPAGAAASEDDILAVSTADPRWTDAMAAFAAAEGAADRTVCFLSRTRAELMPILLALVRGGVRHTTAVRLPADSDRVSSLVASLRAAPSDRHPFAALHDLRAARGWSRGDAGADELSEDDLSALDALLGWSVGFAAPGEFVTAFEAARARIGALRDPSAVIELATVHSSKGREWETVVLIGFEAERIPNRRSLVDAVDADRAMEEERRLAYVALTRATRQLMLVFDPARPSPFLAEMGYAVQ